MTGLAFQLALDPMHAAFRGIRLLPIVRKARTMSTDLYRMIDYYLVFPFEIGDVRLKPAHRRFKRLGRDYERVRPYGQQPDRRLLFERMRPMQLAGLSMLAANGLIESSALKSGRVAAGDGEAPAEIGIRTDELNKAQNELMEFLSILAADYDLLGADGVKARTGLMDHRYDAV